MNEIILSIVVIVILLGSQFLINRIRRPLLFYIRILSAIALLLLIWLFGGDSNIPVRVILSVIALTSIYSGYLTLKKFQSDNSPKQIADNQK